MPLVSVDAMRQAFYRDAGAQYGDIVWWSKSNWKNQLLTPNSTTRYAYFNFNTAAGPFVLDFPAAAGAGLFGSVLDAWQVPLMDLGTDGEDKGKGGKYLLLPPDFNGAVPAGYIPVRFETYNGYGIIRAIPNTSSDADFENAGALLMKLRLYPLARASNPAKQRYIDMADKLFDGIIHFDESFYESLARMVSEEPVQPRDRAIMGLLRTIGIEKGKEFRPDSMTRAALKSAVSEVRFGLVESVSTVEPFWPDSRWGFPRAITSSKTAPRFETATYLDLDPRSVMYFMIVAPSAKPGPAYLMDVRDKKGELLRGANTYRLNVPANAPARQFWAVTVYDRQTCSFIRESSRVGLDSITNYSATPMAQWISTSVPHRPQVESRTGFTLRRTRSGLQYLGSTAPSRRSTTTSGNCRTSNAFDDNRANKEVK
jgi:hypothetical protein